MVGSMVYFARRDDAMSFADEEGFDVAKDFLHVFGDGEYATVFGADDVELSARFEGIGGYLQAVKCPCFGRLIEQVDDGDIYGCRWFF